MKSVKPIDCDLIIQSVKKTGRLLVLDLDWKTCGFAAEVVSMVTEKAFTFLKQAPVRLASPDSFSPTSWSLSNHYYPNYLNIVERVMALMGVSSKKRKELEQILIKKMETPLDSPDKTFNGPF